MKVILKERIENLGKVGDIVEVKDGFARNFLLPKDKALKPTAANLKYIEQHKKKLEIKAIQEESEARELSNAIQGLLVTVKKKASSEGKLFGSVNITEIAEELLKQKVDIDKKKILLSEPLKMVGEYNIKIRLYPGVEPEIKVVVEAETEA